MLPDAECRLKWTYGVEAFQQWCAQRNRSIMTVTTDGKFIYSNLYFCFLLKTFSLQQKWPSNTFSNLIYFHMLMVMNYNKLWMFLYVKFVAQQEKNIYLKAFIIFVWVNISH